MNALRNARIPSADFQSSVFLSVEHQSRQVRRFPVLCFQRGAVRNIQLGRCRVRRPVRPEATPPPPRSGGRAEGVTTRLGRLATYRISAPTSGHSSPDIYPLVRVAAVVRLLLKVR